MSDNRLEIQPIGQHEVWGAAAGEVLNGQKTVKELAEIHGEQLIDDVVSGDLDARTLHSCVTLVNALDREMVELSSGNIDNLDGFRHEAYARRTAHHAGRYALKHVGNNKRMTITAIQRRARQPKHWN